MPVHFVKIDINPQLKAEIGAIQNAHKGPQWFAIGKLHVTLIASKDISFTEQQTSAYQRIAEEIVLAFIQQNGPIKITAIGNIKIDNNNTFAKLPITTTPALEVLQSQLKSAFNAAPELANLAFNYEPPHITVARQPGRFGSQPPFTDLDEQIIRGANADFSSIAISTPLLGDNITVCTAFNLPPIATIPNSLVPTVFSAVSLSYPSAPVVSSAAPLTYTSVPAAQPSISLFSPISTTVVPLETVFKGFDIEVSNNGDETRYYISHQSQAVMQNLSLALQSQCDIVGRNGNRKHVITGKGNPCIILIDENLSLLQGHLFDAQNFVASSTSSNSALSSSSVSPNWPLIDPQPLRDYVTRRSQQGEGITLFGGSSKTNKINAVEKLIQVIEYYNQHGSLQGLPVAPLTPDERKALIKGTLFDDAVKAIVLSNPLIYTWVYDQPVPVSINNKPLGKF